jgi:hypothetical protein
MRAGRDERRWKHEPMNDVTQEIARTYEIYGESPELLSAIDRVLEADPVHAARASFERAGARDFLGLEADAIPLYRDALERGLGVLIGEVGQPGDGC